LQHNADLFGWIRHPQRFGMHGFARPGMI
jgi:hypothetical protein